MATTDLLRYDPTRADDEILTAAGFLAGYSGRTREAYGLDLRQYIGWCRSHELAVFAARRTDIEMFARDLETRGKARATISRRLGTIVGFYRFAEEEGVIERSPAERVRRPRLYNDSHAMSLDRNEMGALLVQAGLAGPREHALCSLLALNGLRVSEATGALIENLAVERGHRTLLVHRKGGKTARIPLAPRTARAMDLVIGERFEGPIFVRDDGRQMDRHGAARIVRRIARRAGIDKKIGPLAQALLHHRLPRCRRGPSRRARRRLPRRSTDHDAPPRPPVT